MKTLRFSGSSDDTFGEYGVTSEDIDNCGTCTPIQCIVSHEEHRLMVVGHYSVSSMNNGCWLVGVAKVKEEDEWPDWPIRIVQNNDTPYSTMLEIDVPSEDFFLEWYSNGRKLM